MEKGEIPFLSIFIGIFWGWFFVVTMVILQPKENKGNKKTLKKDLKNFALSKFHLIRIIMVKHGNLSFSSLLGKFPLAKHDHTIHKKELPCFTMVALVYSTISSSSISQKDGRVFSLQKL